MIYILVYVNYNDGTTKYLDSKFNSWVELEAEILGFHQHFTSYEVVVVRNR